MVQIQFNSIQSNKYIELNWYRYTLDIENAPHANIARFHINNSCFNNYVSTLYMVLLRKSARLYTLYISIYPVIL